MPVVETDCTPVTPKDAKRNSVTPKSAKRASVGATSVGRKASSKSRSTPRRGSGGDGDKGSASSGTAISESYGRSRTFEEEAPPPLLEHRGTATPPPILEKDGVEDDGDELDYNVDDLLGEAEPNEIGDTTRRMSKTRRRSSIKAVINLVDDVEVVGVEGIDGSKNAEDAFAAETRQALDFRRKQNLRKIYSHVKQSQHKAEKSGTATNKRSTGLAFAGNAILQSTKKVLAQNRLMDGMWESNYKRSFASDMMDRSLDLAFTGDWEEYNLQLDELLQNAVKAEAKHGLKVDLNELKQSALRINTILDDQLDAFDSFDKVMFKLKEGEQRMRKDPLDDPESARDTVLQAKNLVELNDKRLADLHMLVLHLARGAWTARHQGTRRISVEASEELFKQIGDRDGKAETEAEWVPKLVEGPLNSRMDEGDLSAFAKLSQRFEEEKANELLKLMSLEMKGETMEDACRDELISEGIEDEDEVEQYLKDLRRAALSKLVSEAVDGLAELTTWRSKECQELTKLLETWLPESLFTELMIPVFSDDESSEDGIDLHSAPLESQELARPSDGTPEISSPDVQRPRRTLERVRARELTRSRASLELQPAENASYADSIGASVRKHSSGKLKSSLCDDVTTTNHAMHPSEVSASWPSSDCSANAGEEPESQLARLQARSEQRVLRRRRTRHCQSTSKEAHENLQKHATLIQAAFRGKRARTKMMETAMAELRTRRTINNVRLPTEHLPLFHLSVSQVDDQQEEMENTDADEDSTVPVRRNSKRASSKLGGSCRENGIVERARSSLRFNEGTRSSLRFNEGSFIAKRNLHNGVGLVDSTANAYNLFPDDADDSDLDNRLRHVHVWRQRGCGRHGGWLRNIGPVHGVKPALPQPESEGLKSWTIPSWRDKFQNLLVPKTPRKGCLLLVENNVSPLAARIRRRCKARKVPVHLLPQVSAGAPEVTEPAAICAAPEIPPAVLFQRKSAPLAGPPAISPASPPSGAPSILPSVQPSSKLWSMWHQPHAMSQITY